jgi:hypothetical protein
MVLVAACAPADEIQPAHGVEPDGLLLGAILPETGPVAFLAPAMVTGLEMAIEEINAKGGVLGRLAARWCRVPVVVHTFHAFSFHDFMGGLRRRLYLFLERRVRKAAHAYVAVAPQVAREAVEDVNGAQPPESRTYNKSGDEAHDTEVDRQNRGDDEHDDE